MICHPAWNEKTNATKLVDGLGLDGLFELEKWVSHNLTDPFGTNQPLPLPLPLTTNVCARTSEGREGHIEWFSLELDFPRVVTIVQIARCIGPQGGPRGTCPWEDGRG